MASYSDAIQRLIEHFSKLPSIGPKSAERIVFYLLYQPSEILSDFGQGVIDLKKKVVICQQCQNFSEQSPCQICSDKKRSQNVICVVAKPQDLLAIEKVGDYEGVYHVLGGVIDPLNDITPEKLKFKQLQQRIANGSIQEVILGLNPDMSGETTMLYLIKLLKQLKVPKISRLARGLPVGSDLEYSDEVTLSNALKGRRQI